MSFFTQAMENIRRGETCARQCCSDSACRIRPAVMDRFDVCLFAHAMVGVLSTNIPMWQYLRFGMTDFKTSYPRRSPVISKYEFFMYPFLLFSDTKRLRTSAGNSIDHTIGGTWHVTLIPTPPHHSEWWWVRESYVLWVSHHEFVYDRWLLGDVAQ